MTADFYRLDDYRPFVPGVASLYLNAMFHIWKGLAMLSVIPLAILIRGRR